VRAEEIAEKLAVPKPFMSKILNRLVNEAWLTSEKGPQGGFSLHPKTLKTPLIHLLELTDGLSVFNKCALRMDECNSKHPCPIHFQFEQVKLSLRRRLETTTISHLLHNDKHEFIRSIASAQTGLF
jgi:Rrf2 family protein